MARTGSGWRQRWLNEHRNKNGFSVLQYYYEQHFTPVGKALFLLLIISLSLGMVGADVLIYIVLSALASLWLGTLLIGFFSRPRQLLMKPTFPGRLQVGQMALIEIEVENTGKSPMFHLQLELRIRVKQHALVLKSVNEFFCLAPGEKQVYKIYWNPQNRGEIQVRDYSVFSLFPLGLLLWRQTQRSGQTYFVYPSPIFPGANPWHGMQGRSRGLSQNSSSLQGESMEFHGLRPWIQGDSPRHIHWPVLARTGQLAIREFQDSPGQEIALVLDLGAAMSSTALETAISVCAGLVEQINAEPMHHLELVWIGNDLIVPLRGRIHTDSILMHLAQINVGATQVAVDKADRRCLEQLKKYPELSLVLLITTAWTEREQKIMQELNRSWAARAYFVSDQPDQADSRLLIHVPIQNDQEVSVQQMQND